MPINLLTIKQAIILIEELTGKPISPRQLRHEIQVRRQLPAQKIANTYFIDPEDIKNYVRRPPGKPKKSENPERK